MNSIKRKIRLTLTCVAFFLSIPLVSLLGVSSQQTSEQIAPEKTASEKTKICLTMIVKNESRIIERCLNSVKGVADCISICDTGSTDNTVELIENFLKTNNIPGKVHRHQWKNFGYNRTLSAKAAQETLQELGFSLPHTYLLLLDADMMLVVKDDFDKEKLTADQYLLIQENVYIAYYNTRLVRASLPWECVGVTHEYWACKSGAQQDQLTTLRIDDHEDGGCKSDKFERDVKLLTQGLIDEPNNERYMFYLAQSHRCLRQYDQSIQWYKNRIEKGGWQEEVWYSKYMIAEMYEEMGFWDQALTWYLDAFQMTPERAEPLWKIAHYYRNHSQNNLAYLFAKQGSQIPYPKQHLLFVEYPVYEYKLDEEISIAAYYTPNKEDGLVAANRLLLKKSTPDHLRNSTERNILFYIGNLKTNKVMPITIDLPLIKENSTHKYLPMNPSIQKTAEGYNVICRAVNFTQQGGKDYRSLDPEDPTIRTRNYLLRYDPSFKLLSQQEIVKEKKPDDKEYRVMGLEDCRLIGSTDSHHWMFSTSYETHPGGVGQSLCLFKNDPQSKGSLIIDKIVPLKSPKGADCEKNWLPFVKNDELHAIYWYDPLTILKVNQETGECETVLCKETAHNFSKFRGSAAPIAFDDGYLALIHEVIFTDQRNYLHRFVYFDKDFQIKKVSKPFVFFHKGIEYCPGMAIDHEGKNCILTVGFEDRQAFIVSSSLDHIRSILEPLP